MNYRTLILALAALGLCATEAAAQGGGRWGDRDRDRGGQDGGPDLGQKWSPDQARDGVEQGRLRPLGDIIRELEGRYGGRLLGQQLAQEGPRTVYRIRWMTEDGRRLDLVVDARGR
jgi:uncharacterized membrane protein YkoI